MHQNAGTKVGMFDIAHTKELRDTFARIHQEASGSNPSGPQFPIKEQYAMYKSCAVSYKALPDEIDVERTEDNLLELIQYLNENGVGVPQIIGYARCFGSRTRSVAMRLHLAEVRQRKQSGQSAEQTPTVAPLFQAPALI